VYDSRAIWSENAKQSRSIATTREFCNVYITHYSNDLESYCEVSLHAIMANLLDSDKNISYFTVS
jgi:hypothetical protein